MQFTVLLSALLITHTWSRDDPIVTGELRTNLIASVHKVANISIKSPQGKLAPDDLEAIEKELMIMEVIPIITQLLEELQLKNDSEWAIPLRKHLKRAQSFVDGKLFTPDDFKALLNDIEEFAQRIPWSI